MDLGFAQRKSDLLPWAGRQVSFPLNDEPAGLRIDIEDRGAAEVLHDDDGAREGGGRVVGRGERYMLRPDAELDRAVRRRAVAHADARRLAARQRHRRPARLDAGQIDAEEIHAWRADEGG